MLPQQYCLDTSQYIVLPQHNIVLYEATFCNKDTLCCRNTKVRQCQCYGYGGKSVARLWPLGLVCGVVMIVGINQCRCYDVRSVSIDVMVLGPDNVDVVVCGVYHRRHFGLRGHSRCMLWFW